MTDPCHISHQTIYLRHRRELIQYATLILSSHADAEDIVQDAYLRLSPENTRASMSEYKSYLFRVVRNLAFDRLRRRRLEISHSTQATPWWGLPQSNPTPEEQMLVSDQIRQIEALLLNMSKDKRLALEMYRFGGYRIEDIAKHLSISSSAAHRLIQSALTELLHKVG